MILALALPTFFVFVLLVLGFVVAFYIGREYYRFDVWLIALTILIWSLGAILVFWSADMAEEAEWDDELDLEFAE